MTMTMSGVHTDASAPLDLRTTTRDITDRTTRQTKTREIVDRTPKIEEVACTARGSHSFSPTIKPDGDECKDSHRQAKVKCERPTDSKSPVSSTSKLPIRKRPVRPDHKPLEKTECTVDEPPAKVLKTDSCPSPAEVPKCSSVRSGLNAETQLSVPSPLPGGAQSEIQLAQATSPCESELFVASLSI